MKMGFRPLYDRLVVQKDEEQHATPGGIIIPDSAKEKPAEGTVLSVGEGRLMMDGTVCPLKVNVGDRVMFGKYSGTEVRVDGEKRLLLKEDDVLGVL